jgi:hypothetical protein
MPRPCHSHSVPPPWRAALIHTCHAPSLPFSDSAVSFVKVRVVAGNILNASPTVERNGMLLITIFVELRVVAIRSRPRTGRPHAVSGRPMLIHTCHAPPLPFSDSAVSFVKVRVVAGNIRTASPTVERIGMLLITIFVELRVVAVRTRTRTGRPHAVSGRPMLIHTCHAHTALCRDLEKSLSERHGRGMGAAWHVCIKHGRTI